MKKNIYKIAAFSTILISLVLPFQGKAQAPVVDWEKSYGGPETEEPTHILATSDGGYLITGQTWANGGQVTGFHADTLPGPNAPDIWVVKTDSIGTLQWQKALGGTYPELPAGAIETYDGNYVIAGSTRSSDGDVTNHQYDYDYWLVMLDTTGNILWNKTFNKSWDEVLSIAPTHDSGFIITGSISNASMSTLIIKFDKNGNNIWEKGIGYGSTTVSAFANAIYQTADSGYILAGQAWFPGGNHDVWIVKTDTGGNKEWEKTYGGSNHDEAIDIQPTNDGGYIIAGWTESADGDIALNKGMADFWIIKTDSIGNMQWEKTYGGSQPDMANTVLVDKDGSFLVGGYTRSWSSSGDISYNHGSTDAWLIKLDTAGALVWEKTYGGGRQEVIYDMIMNKQGNIVFTCSSNSDNGDVSHNHTPGFGKKDDFWVAQLKDVNTAVTQMVKQTPSFVIFPNPAASYIEITFDNSTAVNAINIMSMEGKTLIKTKVNGQTAKINISNLVTGNYLIEVATKDGVRMIKRFVKP